MKKVLIVLVAVMVAGNIFSFRPGGKITSGEQIVSDILEKVLQLDEAKKLPEIVRKKDSEGFFYYSVCVWKTPVNWFSIQYHPERKMMHLAEFSQWGEKEVRAIRGRLFGGSAIDASGMEGGALRYLASLLEQIYNEQEAKKKKREQREQRLEYLKKEGFSFLPSFSGLEMPK